MYCVILQTRDTPEVNSFDIYLLSLVTRVFPSNLEVVVQCPPVNPKLCYRPIEIWNLPGYLYDSQDVYNQFYIQQWLCT